MIRRGALLPWLAIVIYVAGVLLWLRLDRTVVPGIFGPWSIHNDGAEGMSLAFAYLERRAAAGGSATRVAVLAKALDPAEIERDAVVFRIGPAGPPFASLHQGAAPSDAGPPDGEQDSKDAPPPPPAPGRAAALLTFEEEGWIRGGGRMVLGLDGPLGPVSVSAVESPAKARKTHPAWPEVRRVIAEPPRVLVDRAPGHAHAMMSLDGRPLISRRRIGAGDLILIACPEMLRNASLGLGDHLALLEALAGDGRPVYFDETVHGLRAESGVLALLAGWGLGPLMVLGCLAAAAAWMRARVTLGPPVDPHRETRSEAVDLVESVGRLYERALRRRDAIALYHRSLVRAIAVRTGLRGDALEARARDLTGGAEPTETHGRGDMSPADFRRALRAINDAYQRLEHAEPR